MAFYDIASINTSIINTLATATGIKRIQDLDEISDSLGSADLPLIQVYPDSGDNVSSGSATQKYGFGGGTSRPQNARNWTFNADLVVRRRSLLSESFPDFATYTMNVIDVLEEQYGVAPFGNEAINSFQYSWERAVITYSEADFDAARFVISVEIF